VIQAAARKALREAHTGRIRERGAAARRRLGARGPGERSWAPHYHRAVGGHEPTQVGVPRVAHPCLEVSGGPHGGPDAVAADDQIGLDPLPGRGGEGAVRVGPGGGDAEQTADPGLAAHRVEQDLVQEAAAHGQHVV
jgi:hypothetical protein